MLEKRVVFCSVHVIEGVQFLGPRMGTRLSKSLTSPCGSTAFLFLTCENLSTNWVNVHSYLTINFKPSHPPGTPPEI